MLIKLKESTFLSKAATLSSSIWFISVLIFIIVILMSSQGFTKDPCFSAGCTEERWLFPLLGSVFLGIASFCLLILSGFLRRILKATQWKPWLHLSATKVSVATMFIIIIIGVYFAGSLNSAVMFGGSYNGQELLEAVNKHRQEKGLNSVVVGEGLCDNLVSRWQAVKEGRQHLGFEEWIKGEGIQLNYGYGEIAELYIQAPTPAEAIAFWAGSPGHRIQLENPKWTDGCAYANEGYGVVILSVK